MDTFCSSFLQQKGVKTSLSLVNEFTGADVSLDKAAGGLGGGVVVVVVGGFKSLATEEKRVGTREGEKPGTKTVQSTGH